MMYVFKKLLYFAKNVIIHFIDFLNKKIFLFNYFYSVIKSFAKKMVIDGTNQSTCI